MAEDQPRFLTVRKKFQITTADMVILENFKHAEELPEVMKNYQRWKFIHKYLDKPATILSEEQVDWLELILKDIRRVNENSTA